MNRNSVASKLAMVLGITATQWFSVAGIVSADSASPVITTQDAKGRIVYREDRPDDTRGWFVAAKSTFWPLCYEALDRLEETRTLVEKGDNEALADSLEKCGSWLSLAASAAMTEGKAGIADVGLGLTDLAAVVRKGEFEGSNEDFQNSITLAEICMAKSHVLRAVNIDDDSSSILKERRNGVATSAAVKEGNRDIQANQIEARRAQYQYDAQQIERHLRVAQTYLTQAAESGKFELSETFSAPIPSLKTATAEDAIVFIEEVRTRLDNMMAEGDKLRSDWMAKVDFLMEE